MSRFAIVSMLGLALSASAFASSHSESPYRRGGTTGRTVVEPTTIADQLRAMYSALMGETPPVAPTAAPTIQVRRLGYTPSR